MRRKDAGWHLRRRRFFRSRKFPPAEELEHGPKIKEMRKKLSPYIIAYESFAGTPESLNGKYFSLLHFVSIVVFDKGNLFTAMDMVPKNIMACNVSDGFHREELSGNLDFVAFHHLLDRGADVTHPCVNASMLSMHQLHNSQFNICALKQTDVLWCQYSLLPSQQQGDCRTCGRTRL